MEPFAPFRRLRPTMSDDAQKASTPAPEKDESKKVDEIENPKKHGSQVHGSEAGGDPGEGRTGTKLGSTDS